MVKLFSIFPQSVTSAGLVLLRVGVVMTLQLDSLGRFALARPDWYLVLLWICSAALVAGFLTPLFAAAAVVGEVTVFIGTGAETAWPAVAAVNAVALALLGPGDYSLDARLFGRRTVVMTVRREPGERGPPS